MFKLIKESENVSYGENIFTMTTVGRSQNPNFCVAVNPSTTRLGECYLKYYNKANYFKATKLARLNLRKPEKVYHRNNRESLEEWNLNSHDRKALCDFLDSVSTKFKAVDVTYWQLVLFNWNNEWGFLESDFPDSFNSDVEAFIGGWFDTKENLANPSYMPSYSVRPDYLSVLN